jgi:hypothetical protein
MEIERVKELHTKLEQDIYELLVKFERETDLYIEDVEAHRMWTLGNERSHLSRVVVKCLL